MAAEGSVGGKMAKKDKKGKDDQAKVGGIDMRSGQAADVVVSDALAPAVANRQQTPDALRHTMAGITKEQIAEITHLLETDEKITHEEIKERYSLCEREWLALRKHLDDSGRGFNRARWARHTAATLSRFTALGADRLAAEVNEMPLAALPIAVAIAIDKLILLSSDRPTVVVEARLRLTADDLSRMLHQQPIIDVTPIDTPN